MNLDLGKRVDEQLRRVSSRVTKNIALRAGDHYDMYLGSGYPKSGTSWLCQLMGHYLDAPHPQNYSSPIAMRAVLHNHWLHDDRFPPSVYIIRDGRDVMVSLYFYMVRAVQQPRHPRQAARLKTRFDQIFPAGYDLDDIESNLPAFIRAEHEDPIAFRGTSWTDHVRSWCEVPHANVTTTRYEDLLASPTREFTRIMTDLLKQEADPRKVEQSVARYDFGTSGRKAGVEDRTSFMRKGVSGDWRNHFTAESATVLHEFAGSMLTTLGYEDDPEWADKL